MGCTNCSGSYLLQLAFPVRLYRFRHIFPSTLISFRPYSYNKTRRGERVLISVCGSGPFFSDPDPGDPKTGSDRIRILLRYVFDVKQNTYFLWHFLTKSKHLMTLEIKDKKVIWTKLNFRQFYITRKFELQGYFCG